MPVLDIVMVYAAPILLVMPLGMPYAAGTFAIIGAMRGVIAGAIVIGLVEGCIGIAEGTLTAITVITDTRRGALGIFPY